MIAESDDLSKAAVGPATTLHALLDDGDDLAPGPKRSTQLASGEQPDTFVHEVNSVGGTLPHACQNLSVACHVGSARHSTMPLRHGRVGPDPAAGMPAMPQHRQFVSSLHRLRHPKPNEIQLQSPAFTCRRQGARSVSRTVLPGSTVSRVSVAKGEDASRCMTCSAAL